MKVESLRITNMRGLAALELRLQPGLNLLVGENGCGKTTVLDALEQLLAHTEPRPEDIRTGAAELSLAAWMVSPQPPALTELYKGRSDAPAQRFYHGDVRCPLVVRRRLWPSPARGASSGEAWMEVLRQAIRPFEPSEETEALVLIDGLELGLHPRLQREVVHELTATFPRCQFIATTHSPIILGEVRREQIHLLTPEGVFHPDCSYGLEASRVLEEIMDTPARPREIEEHIRRISVLALPETLSQARDALMGLAAKLELGENDPEVVRLSACLAFMEGDDLPDNELLDEDNNAASQDAP